MLDAAPRQAIRRRVHQLNPNALWCEVEHRPEALVSADGQREPLAGLAGRRIVAFCGIGNPAGFRHTLTALNGEIAAWREFPDHHAYTRKDVDELAELARTSGATTAVCTRKDLVKLRVPSLGGAPLRAVAIALNFLHGEAELEALLRPLAARARETTPAYLQDSARAPAASD
jgi:tetraacyldisaccharide 4'-kinase